MVFRSPFITRAGAGARAAALAAADGGDADGELMTMMMIEKKKGLPFFSSCLLARHAFACAMLVFGMPKAQSVDICALELHALVPLLLVRANARAPALHALVPLLSVRANTSTTALIVLVPMLSVLANGRAPEFRIIIIIS